MKLVTLSPERLNPDSSIALSTANAPCANPDFCRACRDADRRKARGKRPRFAPLRPAPSPMDLPKANLEGKNWKGIAAEAWAGWKQAALEYHHARGNHALIVEIALARLHRLMSDSVSLYAAWAELNDFRNRPTPKTTIEAVIHAVRERGLAALKEPTTVERLERCDAAARADINRRIEKLGLKPCLTTLLAKRSQM